MPEFFGKMKYECDPETLDVDMCGNENMDDYQKACVEVLRGHQEMEFHYRRFHEAIIMSVSMGGVEYRLIPE